ncbi:MAG: GxxExxY protein [Candidatus Cloacimonetes bacterium]|nr:GxxExxY protein [Candidatus Cloacimonadota bacterium]
MTLDELNKISKQVLDAAIEVHKQLGPGLLESVYEYCLCKELELRNINYKKQVNIPVFYKNEPVGTNFIIDILVENELILELKTVEKILPVHNAQLLSYLRLTNKRLGILINFNVPRLVDGWKRIINGYDE